MDADAIVNEITRRAWRFGVAVLMDPGKEVDCDGLKTSGWFDGDDKRLVCATKQPLEVWLGTLIHEYCHLTQWVEQTELWRVNYKTCDRVREWLDGKSVPNIGQYVVAMREMEAECERRAIRMMRELDAPLDVERYARGANAYIHFHNIMLEKRKWYASGRGPYSVPEVMAAANPTFDTNFDKTPAHLRAVLLTCI